MPHGDAIREMGTEIQFAGLKSRSARLRRNVRLVSLLICEATGAPNLAKCYILYAAVYRPRLGKNKSREEPRSRVVHHRLPIF